jgi:hypothetical protein
MIPVLIITIVIAVLGTFCPLLVSEDMQEIVEL